MSLGHSRVRGEKAASQVCQYFTIRTKHSVPSRLSVRFPWDITWRRWYVLNSYLTLSRAQDKSTLWNLISAFFLFKYIFIRNKFCVEFPKYRYIYRKTHNVYPVVHTLLSTAHVACHPVSVTLCCTGVPASMGAGCPVDIKVAPVFHAVL